MTDVFTFREDAVTVAENPAIAAARPAVLRLVSMALHHCANSRPCPSRATTSAAACRAQARASTQERQSKGSGGAQAIVEAGKEACSIVSKEASEDSRGHLRDGTALIHSHSTQVKTSYVETAHVRIPLVDGLTDYARRHGYDLIVDYEAHAKNDRGPVWWKFDMIRRLIKQDEWDWIWWLDFDTLITNTEIKVSDIIEETLKNATNPDELDYLFSHDCNALNLGSFVVRSHQRSINFLDSIDAVEMEGKKKDPKAQLSEQDAITTFMEQQPALTKKRTAVIPQWMINAFPDEIPCYEEPERPWEPGFFLVHFAGAWAHVEGEDPTGQLMRKYQGEILWGDKQDFD